ncbi:hypothetical protein E1B28_008636 [Marasmius oreades]|uniref:Uncharacterized protein n=1 Tax=Marasmius oreades TaxID=181124 RepID=A0A9P7RYR1_9AGAR|nr:uncharacterized protein E1B28_008636 [Marasmius oreades]KAG7092274.1 hypothetical protein E1B28_008636 [Marasmius oreades]
MNLFPRFRRQSHSSNTSNTTTLPVETPSLQAIQRRIHPNLNTLAAELTSSTPETILSPQISLKPWIPKKVQGNVAHHIQESQSPEPRTPTPTTGSRLPIPARSSSSLASHNTRETTDNTSPTASTPPQTGSSVIRRIVSLSRPLNVRPPSAWNSLAKRRKSRRPNAIPHASDFGNSSDNDTPSHSRKTSETPHTPDDSVERFPGDETSHSRSSSNTQPKNLSPNEKPSCSLRTASPPHSTTFTFGRKGPSGPNSPDVLPPPLRPALNLSLFSGLADAVDLDHSFRFKLPRTAVSMPMLNPQQSTSDEEENSNVHVDGRMKRFIGLPENERKMSRSASVDHSSSRRVHDDNRVNQSHRVLGESGTRTRSLYLDGPFDDSNREPVDLESLRYHLFNSFRHGDPENSGSEMPSGLDYTLRSLSSRDVEISEDRSEVALDSDQNTRASAGQPAPTSPLKLATSANHLPQISQSAPSTANSRTFPNPQTPSQSKGKRKADEVEAGGNTPPEARKQKATFANDPRPHRISGASGSSAPSSYTRKKARLSAPSSAVAMPAVGEGSDGGVDLGPPSQNDPNRHAGNTGSWSRGSRTGGAPPHRTPSRISQGSEHHPNRAASASQHRGPSRQSNHPPPTSSRVPSRRGSISQVSIPISALISPHAPSISTNGRPNTFHMRDPRKPPRIQPTPWSLSFPQVGYGEKLFLLDRLEIWSKMGFSSARNRAGEDEEGQREPNVELIGWTESGGSPLHAWLFFIGFVLFPVWWAAAILAIPRTRRIGAEQEEKKMTLDDPQVEHDATSWRRRCRIMAIVSLFTYVPFIVLVAVFARRR